jgi:hypothetical protein
VTVRRLDAEVVEEVVEEAPLKELLNEWGRLERCVAAELRTRKKPY